MERARKSLEKEVDVIQMIRHRRFVDMALRLLLEKPVHDELKVKSKYEEVSSSRREDNSSKSSNEEAQIRIQQYLEMAKQNEQSNLSERPAASKDLVSFDAEVQPQGRTN